ncbi:hypothetical protein FRX31_018626, partial [Thalictrum thalictroides]
QKAESLRRLRTKSFLKKGFKKSGRFERNSSTLLKPLIFALTLSFNLHLLRLHSLTLVKIVIRSASFSESFRSVSVICDDNPNGVMLS